MKLREILHNIETLQVIGSTDMFISELSIDSRNITQGNLFFAIPGTEVDGHTYIQQAIQQGALAIVCEVLPEQLTPSVCYIQVSHTSSVVGIMASTFFGNPTQELTVIGVTGTNGKTSIAYSLYHALLLQKKEVALFSTISNILNGEVFQAGHTTEDAISLQRHMRQVADGGAKFVCMEVSSHALEQGRVQGVDFDIALYTNLTQDHLDYHHTMEAYAKAKKKFFDMLKPSSVAIVNADDSYAEYMIQETKASTKYYGMTSGEYRISSPELEMTQSSWMIQDTRVVSKHIGLFNVYNQTCVYAVLDTLGFEDADKTLSMIPGIPGRMEMVSSAEKGITGIVDYAHTPDALKKVLETISLVPHRKIITIFGCGGDREREKRPQMARIAEELSDIVIVTSDNPRTEDQNQIFSDIEKGFTKSATEHAVITERNEAIKRGVQIAQEGDVILIAGKGHENYQIIGTSRFPFNDKEILQSLLS